MSSPPCLRPLAAALLALVAGCRLQPREVPYPAVVRGHQEVRLETAADGSLEPVPLFLLPGAATAGLCLEVPAALDTSSWQAVLTVSGRPAGPASPPAVRMGTTLCFDGPLAEDLPRPAALELCVDLTEATGAPERRLCRPIRTGGAQAWQALRQRLGELLARAAARPAPELAAHLDRLAAEASRAALPLLAVRLQLIAVHFLSVAEELEPAARRLADLPSWLAAGAAGARAAQAAYLEAQVALLDGRRGEAWQAFERADRLYVRTADPARFTVAMQRAALLSDAGAGHEAVVHLRQRLAECEHAPCDPALLAAARLQMARLVLADPFRTRGELEEARRGLDAGPVPGAAGRVSPLIVEAALQLELGEDPAPFLAAAGELLDTLPAEPMARSFEGWIRWLRGQAALSRGDAAAAIAACLPLAAVGERSLAAWAWGCAARAYRLQGDLAAAELAFEKTLAYHEHGSAASLGLELAMGLGPQADDVLWAARVAVERGEPSRAWRILARLDQRSAHEARRRRCRESARDPQTAARWREIEGEIEQALADLAALAQPSSVARETEAEGVRQALRERLLSLWRSWPGCEEEARSPIDGADLRAFAAGDEVILLGRSEGRIVTVRRTPFAQADLGRLAGEVAAALGGRGLDDRAWRRLLAPAAEALLPADLDTLPPRVTYALHGILQALPLAALPLPPAAPGAWLSDLTVVSVQPAGARSSPTPPGGAAAPPLFVVDPLGDLPHASRSAAAYRASFPRARILRRSAATRRALEEGLAGAEWLHLDTHASYEAGFPELSSLVVADGTLTLLELSRLPAPRRFANLSGCRTGSWHPTADSGRYGLGGLLARLGVPWTVATRAPLSDLLAEDYNAAFYRAIARGAGPSEAHGVALARQRSRHPAVAWGALILLRAPEGGEPRAEAGQRKRPADHS